VNIVCLLTQTHQCSDLLQENDDRIKGLIAGAAAQQSARTFTSIGVSLILSVVSMALSGHLPRVVGAAARNLTHRNLSLAHDFERVTRTYKTRANLKGSLEKLDTAARSGGVRAVVSRGFAATAGGGLAPIAARAGAPPPPSGLSWRSFSWLLSIPAGAAAYYAYTHSQRPQIITPGMRILKAWNRRCYCSWFLTGHAGRTVGAMTSNQPLSPEYLQRRTRG
jgi:hypothetical protein